MQSEKNQEWERLLSAQMVFQTNFPECVLIGGTKKHFTEILKKVEEEAGWRTKKLEPPVLILGNFQGVRTGIRQLIRSKPLETMTVRGLKIPTPEEILRIKAFFIVKRNATRDFIDFIALFDHLGTKRSLEALATLDTCYPQGEGSTVSQQLILQLAEPKPWNLLQTDLSSYKNLKAPYTDWNEIKRRTLAASQKITVEVFKR